MSLPTKIFIDGKRHLIQIARVCNKCKPRMTMSVTNVKDTFHAFYYWYNKERMKVMDQAVVVMNV